MTNDTSRSANSSALVEATVERTYSASGKNLDYAQQLINMLEKKNRALNLVWPTLLVIAIGLGFALLNLYQDNRLTAKELDHTEQILKTRNEQLSATENSLKQTNFIHKSLKNELTGLIEQNRSWLPIENNATLSHATSSTSSDSEEAIISALNTILTQAAQSHQLQQEQIAKVQAQLAKSSTDFKNIKIAYSALQNRVTEQTSELSTTMEKIDTLNADRDKNVKKLQQDLAIFKRENVRLQKEVNKRRSAFDALAKRYKGTQKRNQKLSDKLADKQKTTANLENQLQASKNKLKTTLQQLNSIKASYARLENRFESLDKNLKAITQPIRQTAPLSMPHSTLTPQAAPNRTVPSTPNNPDSSLKTGSKIPTELPRGEAKIIYPDVALPD